MIKYIVITGEKLFRSLLIQETRKSIIGRMTSAIINVFSDSSTNEVENFEISSPYNFKVLHHVQVNPESSIILLFKYEIMNNDKFVNCAIQQDFFP